MKTTKSPPFNQLPKSSVLPSRTLGSSIVHRPSHFFSLSLALNNPLPLHCSSSHLTHRVRKNGAGHFTLLIASAQSKLATHKHTHNDKEIQLDVEYGDFSSELANAAAALTEAKKYAANQNQIDMLDGYIKR